MTLPLLHLPWLPLVRRSGAVTWAPPDHLTDGIQSDKDPIVALVAPRPDMQGATLEFLIGLLTVALRPANEREWRRWWERPPTREELRERFAALPHAFALGGDGPRFFQDRVVADFDAAKADVIPIAQLLIDAPGGQTISLNKDLFVKRGMVERLGPAAAAMALLTLQTYSPAGGRGNRTSLRGGGPLTTLVDPRVGQADHVWQAYNQPLWRLLWANVQTVEQWDRYVPASLRTADGTPTWDAVFPWLVPTLTSETKTGGTTSLDAHPLQAFFGLPRRIRLEFGGPGRCDVTGRDEEVTVVGFRMRPYGVQYVGWKHPLTPHYRAKDKQSGAEMMLPLHGQPGGVGWRDWLGLTLQTPSDEGAREPAAAVGEFLHRRAESLDLDEVRLLAFGYDFDNMKARGWVTAVQPAFATAGPAHAALLADTARRLTQGTDIAAAALLDAVRRALYASDEVPGDLSAVKSDLWAETTDAFFATMRSLVRPGATYDDAETRCAGFREVMAPRALAVFDRRCPTGGLAPQTLRRLVSARYSLTGTLRGSGKFGAKMFGPDGFRLPLDTARPRSSASPSAEEATT